MTEDRKKTLDKVMQIDQRRIQDHVHELVRCTVAEMFKGRLDAEAEALFDHQSAPRSDDPVLLHADFSDSLG